MSAEEATERLAEALDDAIWGVLWDATNMDTGKAHQISQRARKVVLKALRSLPAEDIAVLLAGRPVEERAKAAGSRQSAVSYTHPHFGELWVEADQ